MALEYDLVRSVYTGCACFCFSFGMVFNAFLVWLIRTKTPAPMLVYSKLLLTPCMMDIFLCFFTFLVQPIPIVDHGYHAVVQNGFFRHMSGFYNYTANVVWFQVLLLSVCATTVQFVFRYYMIFNDGHVPKRLKYITGTVLAVLLFAHVMLHYLSDYPYAEYDDQMAQLAIWVHEEVGITDIRFSSFTPARSYVWILHCLAMLIIFGICYAIIVYCARGTCNYITKAYENAAAVGTNGDASGRADTKKNEKMREYNNQITTAMTVQAILPTVEVIELTTQVTLPIFVVQGGTVYFMVYAAIPLYFIPVMNPLATMLFVKPYRKALFKLILTSVGHHHSTVSVQAFQRRAGTVGARMMTKTAACTDRTIVNRHLRMVGGGGGMTTEVLTEETASSASAPAGDRFKQQSAPSSANGQHGQQRQEKAPTTEEKHDNDTSDHRLFQTSDGILDLTLDQLDAMNANKNMKFSGIVDASDSLNYAQSDSFDYHDHLYDYNQSSNWHSQNSNSQNIRRPQTGNANGIVPSSSGISADQRHRATTMTVVGDQQQRQQMYSNYKKRWCQENGAGLEQEATAVRCETISISSTTKADDQQ